MLFWFNMYEGQQGKYQNGASFYNSPGSCYKARGHIEPQQAVCTTARQYRKLIVRSSNGVERCAANGIGGSG